jgi:ribose transport system ATP-binding protein
VAVVYISHRLEELARIADRVAVLRDGRLVAAEAMGEVSTDRLVSLMAGRELAAEGQAAARTPGPPRLRVRRLGRGAAVRDVSFEVRSGEILGISGLVGAGRTELLRLVYGADRAETGTIEVGDPPAPARVRSPAEAVRRGIAMVGADRKGDGLLLPQSVAANLALGNVGKVSSYGLLDAAREAALGRRRIEALGIRTRGPEQPVEELSGGNQQKVVIGRALEQDAEVLLFDEPTRGVDVGAKADVHRLLGGLAQAGKAVVVVSSDLRELTAISDRIAVMSAGRLVATFARGEWSEDALLAAAYSGHAGRDAQLEAPAA